ncbi:MAG TPA: hypothetical protein VHM90_20445, partial [Phycisphaerae bacterium]|nr:hypothetical protein [Phycisphaerae bacterium]
MPNILLTWELGSGIGHLMNLRPLGIELAQRGHTVTAALRDLSHAQEIFAGTGISYLPAPLRLREGKRPFEPAVSFAHLFGNIGFADAQTVHTLFHSWNALFDLAQPDLVIADHSPSPLLALRGRIHKSGRPIPCVNVGIGFFAPPDAPTLPHWLPNATPPQLERLKKD